MEDIPAVNGQKSWILNQKNHEAKFTETQKIPENFLCFSGVFDDGWRNALF